MRLDGPLLTARLVDRPNRFVLVLDPEKPFDDEEAVEVPSGPIRVHLPNPGRLPEFREPGNRWVVRHTPGRDRKTQWRAVLGWHRGRFVVLDTHLTNPLVGEALDHDQLPPFAGRTWRSEVSVGDHRFDFASGPEDDLFLLEVKSVNLVPSRTALFPDAPTSRGTSHVRSLTEHVEAGGRAGVLLVVARDDVDEVRPNTATDPDFAAALADAVDAGVDVRAWTTRLDGREWGLADEVPVRLDGALSSEQVGVDDGGQ